ncbi:MAG: hypothetical protein IPH59_06490 [bacterium]|nr:hypothetical protein [bacterium]
MNLFDGILAILAGYGAMYIVTKTFLTVLAVSTSASSNQDSTLPGTGHIATILIGAFVAALIGGFVACIIAKRSPIKHTIALSAVAVVMGLMTRLTSTAEHPAWYTAALIGLSVLGIMSAGGLMQIRKRARERRL